MCLNKPLNVSAPLFLSASCSSEKRGVMSGTFCLLSPHTQFPAPSGCFHVCPGSTGSTPPSLPWPLSPPFTSSFMRLGLVLLCISRNLAFLRSVFHRYPVTLGIKSSLVTAPFQTRKSSVYVSFHTSCPFSLCPGIGTRQAGPFIFVPFARVVLVLSLVSPLPLQGPGRCPLYPPQSHSALFPFQCLHFSLTHFS